MPRTRRASLGTARHGARELGRPISRPCPCARSCPHQRLSGGKPIAQREVTACVDDFPGVSDFEKTVLSSVVAHWNIAARFKPEENDAPVLAFVQPLLDSELPGV